MAIMARAAAAGVAACTILLGAVMAPTATAAPAPGAAALLAAAPLSAPQGEWAPADLAAIHPGVLTVTAGGGSCTSNFVFTAGSRTFLGQAAHCAGTGPATEVDGCSSATLPLGSPVVIEAADGTERTATLAYSSWVTMQDLGETDPDTCTYNDFALVEIAPADVADVSPTVPFFGGPTGIDTDGLRAGEEMFTYGRSSARTGTGTPAPKAGVSADDLGGGWGHEIHPNTPAVAGDSGSAFLDGAGTAIGILTTLNLGSLPVSNGVSDLARALTYANANGGLGELELVLGTQPFTATPPGVPPTAVAPPAGPPIGA